MVHTNSRQHENSKDEDLHHTVFCFASMNKLIKLELSRSEKANFRRALVRNSVDEQLRNEN